MLCTYKTQNYLFFCYWKVLLLKKLNNFFLFSLSRSPMTIFLSVIVEPDEYLHKLKKNDSKKWFELKKKSVMASNQVLFIYMFCSISSSSKKTIRADRKESLKLKLKLFAELLARIKNCTVFRLNFKFVLFLPHFLWSWFLEIVYFFTVCYFVKKISLREIL